MANRKNQSGFNQDVVFVGWQETFEGTHLALFTVLLEEHPLYGSTVCEPTLRKFQLNVPRIPHRENELNEIRSSKIGREMRDE
jgi:hypothetical protein